VNPVDEQAPDAPDEYAELVREAAAGDGEALERLLMRAQEVAWRFSTSVCGHADDAEDAMQEALIKTYRYVGRIREPGAFKPWLYRTVRNACLVGRRKRAGEPVRIESLDGASFAGPMARPEGFREEPGAARRQRRAPAPPSEGAADAARSVSRGGVSARDGGLTGDGDVRGQRKTRLHWACSCRWR
jgi:RNA polymerase sigma factor (sigma-70 family)